MRRIRYRDVEKSKGSCKFWFIEGVGWMSRKTFRQWLRMVEEVGAGVALPPLHFSAEPPPEAFPAMTVDAEQLGMTCLAEGLYRRLKASGRFRKLESKVEEMEGLLRSTRELLRAEAGAAQ